MYTNVIVEHIETGKLTEIKKFANNKITKTETEAIKEIRNSSVPLRGQSRQKRYSNVKSLNFVNFVSNRSTRPPRAERFARQVTDLNHCTYAVQALRRHCRCAVTAYTYLYYIA